MRLVIFPAPPLALGWLLLPASTLVGCGGIVVFEGAGDGGGGAGSIGAVGVTSVGATSSAGTGTSAGPSTSGASASTAEASSSGSGGVCSGQPCGTFCQECPRCSAGTCDEEGACVPSVVGTAEECPPAQEVVSGGACAEEGYLCASDASCSGLLQCICGQWVLIHPC